MIQISTFEATIIEKAFQISFAAKRGKLFKQKLNEKAQSLQKHSE